MSSVDPKNHAQLMRRIEAARSQASVAQALYERSLEEYERFMEELKSMEISSIDQLIAIRNNIQQELQQSRASYMQQARQILGEIDNV